VDHYLGWLATDDHYLETGKRRYGADFGFGGDNTQTYLDPEGTAVDTFHLPSTYQGTEAYRGCGHPDPGHGWDAGRAQRDGGFLAAGSGNDEYALGYYLGNDLPLYATLARQYTTFDHYHCSLLAPTFPNREYMHSAQSGGLKSNALPPEVPGHQTGFTWDTIWDRLRDQAGMVPGVDAGYFFVDLPAIMLWGPRMLPFMQHLEDFFARAASGTLPKVCFVDPGFTTGLRTDDHPYADVRAGQNLVGDIVKAFMEGPQWERGVLFVNYDEWGGFFDHVPPPLLPDDRTSEGFDQAGFRTPTFMVSPYALPGYVGHDVYDHTSILRFLEWRFLGAPATGSGGDGWWLTTRDRNANNIGALLQATKVNDGVDVPLALPVTSAPCSGEELEGTFVDSVIHDALDQVTEQLPGAPTPAASPELEWHAFEKALHAGFFEQMGYEVDLRRSVPTL
ncbi:MAG TPA: alkaline phosphatase family protein, partial [Acidimicrobiia bacterium]|nr:alkaline phosphatase family protein [Acidimicrobiia bacterium]